MSEATHHNNDDDLSGLLRELVERVETLCPVDGIHQTVIEPLHLIRRSQPNEPMHVLYEPAVCLIIQGSKRAILEDETYRYDPFHYLVISVDLPVIGQVIEATPEKPYLCLRLALDALQISELIRDVFPQAVPEDPDRGLFLSRVDNSLLDPFLRLVQLLDRPRDIPILAPMVVREIIYRLLLGEQAGQLRQIALADSQSQRISRVVDMLKLNYTKPLRIEQLAREAHMSVSGLHHNFKKVTAMSPLQYQKRLRLLEARRLLLAEKTDITTICHRVGYESPSQFSREYSRLFGAPPSRDLKRLKASAGV